MKLGPLNAEIGVCRKRGPLTCLIKLNPSIKGRLNLGTLNPAHPIYLPIYPDINPITLLKGAMDLKVKLLHASLDSGRSVPASSARCLGKEICSSSLGFRVSGSGFRVLGLGWSFGSGVCSLVLRGPGD